jgi:hypothetical protein
MWRERERAVRESSSVPRYGSRSTGATAQWAGGHRSVKKSSRNGIEPGCYKPLRARSRLRPPVRPVKHAGRLHDDRPSNTYLLQHKKASGCGPQGAAQGSDAGPRAAPGRRPQQSPHLCLSISSVGTRHTGSRWFDTSGRMPQGPMKISVLSRSRCSCLGRSSTLLGNQSSVLSRR